MSKNKAGIGCGTSLVVVVIFSCGLIWMINHFSLGDSNPSRMDKSGGAESVAPEPIPSFPTASEQQLKAIQSAMTFPAFKAALQATYPSIKEVTWWKPIKDDPKSELQIVFSSKVHSSAAKRKELLLIYRELVPVIIKAKNPWGVLNLDNGAVLVLERSLGRDTDFSTATFEELQALSNRSVGL